jgi:hypothetical protein
MSGAMRADAMMLHTINQTFRIFAREKKIGNKKRLKKAKRKEWGWRMSERSE